MPAEAEGSCFALNLEDECLSLRPRRSDRSAMLSWNVYSQERRRGNCPLVLGAVACIVLLHAPSNFLKAESSPEGRVPEGRWAENAPHSDRGSWPRFRGPNGKGEVDGVEFPLPWKAADYRWQVKLPGIGHSSPVVMGEKVFVTSGLPESGTQILLAFQAQDGKLLWEKRYPGQLHRLHQFNSYASSTPALDNRRVFWAWAVPEALVVVALEQSTGQELWRRELGPFVSEHGFGSSPVVIGDTVILANEQDGESFIVALSAETGEIRWQTPRRTVKTAYSTPCVFQPQNGPPQLLLTSWAHGVCSLDLQSGTPLWEIPVFRYRVVSSPCLVGGFVIASCGEGGAGRQLVIVRPPESQGDVPKVTLQLSQDIPYVPTAVGYRNLAFLWSDRGVVTCVDVKSSKVLWRERLGGFYFASPIRIGERILNISRQGEVVVVGAKEEFELLARFAIEEGTHATPAVAGDTLFIRTFSRLAALPGRVSDSRSRTDASRR